LVLFLVEHGAGLERKDYRMRTALTRAVRKSHWDIAKYLTEKGANVNTQMKFGQTPLFHVVWFSKTAFIDLLLDYGADTNLATHKPYPNLAPIHVASMQGNFDVLRKLVEFGANVNAKCENGTTPLMTAAAAGNLLIVEYLTSPSINAAINIKRKESDGHVAIEEAAIHGHKKIVKLLSTRGARTKNRWGLYKHPIWRAIGDRDWRTAKILSRPGRQ
jgi:ankyrin repeat protein